MRWTKLAVGGGAAPLARSSHSLTAVGRSLFVFGGEHAPRTPVDAAVHKLDLETGAWATLAPAGGAVPCARVAHAAAAVGDVVLNFGGRTGVDESRPLADFWAFDTRTAAWTELAPGPPARSYHAAASLGGAFYVFGGCGAAGRLSDLWRYDVAAAAWEPMPAPPAGLCGRGGACLAALGDHLYVATGFSGTCELSDLWRFDPAAREWACLEAASGSMPPRSVAALGALGSRLLLFGGEAEVSALGHAGAGKFNADVWAWDTASAAPGWLRVEVAGPGPCARGWLAAAAMPGAGLAVHGGNTDSNERVGDAWLLSEE